jgi:hypothetical protein
MKTKVLLASVAASLFSVGAWAELPESGNFLIQNVETGYYLGGGHDWGTHASLIGEPQWFNLTEKSYGEYSFNSYQYNNASNHFLATGLYVDGAETSWTLEELEDGTFTISNGGNYIASNGANEVITTVTDASSASAVWKLISTADFFATLATATADNPVDATALIKNPEFKRNANTSFYPTWTVTGADGTGKPSNYSEGQGDNNANIAESYHSSNGFKFVQEISDAPAGYYQLNAQAFYREDGSDTNLPYVFMNDEKSTFPLLTGTENNMIQAYQAFLNGTYPIDPITVQIAEGESLTLGVCGPATDKWNIWGEFKLTYYGTESPIKPYIVAYESALENAQNVLQKAEEAGEYVSEDLKTSLELIISVNSKQPSTIDGLKAAKQALTDAAKAVTENLNAMAKAKAVKDDLDDLLAKNNFYTEEALAQFEEDYELDDEELWAAYDEATLTGEDVDGLPSSPYTLLGWHQANVVDDLLLSVWGTKDYEGVPYINTWSTEGTTDGSNFLVPFFEYWTGDAATLAARELTATLTGLTPNTVYSVVATSRVRLSNGKTDAPYGITFQVGKGTAVNVCDGDAYGQLYVKDTYAEGSTDENGTLVVKYIIAEDNNISWLSYKNLLYTDTGIPTSVQNVEAATEGKSISIFNLSGQKLNTLQKGINIVDGKKVYVK